MTALLGLTYASTILVAPKINRSYLASDVNAEVGKEFKISIPYTGGPIKTAKFSNVS